ncbi:MAG TPA: hypothetical protein VI300_01240 [Solirubrobacter sp.]
MPQPEDDADVFYSDFDRSASHELRSADADTEDGPRRHQLIADVLARYRSLPQDAAATFVYPEQHRDWRAGDRIALMVAAYSLATEHKRYTSTSIELERAHLTTGGLALSEGIHAIEIRWNTQLRLAERQRAWKPHPALPHDP